MKAQDYLPTSVVRLLVPLRLHKGDFLLRQAQVVDGLYFLERGRLLVGMDNKDGQGGTLAVVEPGTVIGDLELFTEQVSTCSVFAPKEAHLVHLSARDADRAGKRDPDFLHFLLAQVRAKLSEASYQRHQTSVSLRARLLLYLFNVKGQDDTVHLERRCDLASLLGTSERHLNRTFQQLQKEGIVSVKNRCLRILDASALSD